jgi:glycosyltransferase involved in cell wall biosynthesis
VIPNWADTEAIRPLDGPSPLRSAQGWDDRFVVMHSGNVGLSQGLVAFVGAAELLSDQRDVVLAIVGEGGSKASLEGRVRRAALENVVFLPYQPKSELSGSLGAADLHFIGLRRGLEGLIVPSKVYGIMAAGRPSLAAVQRGSEIDLIQQEFRCGSRVEPDDPRSIADGILAAREAPLDEQGAAARQAAVAHFGRHTATGAYRELLERVAAR